jgi:hypothetical protein
MPKKIPKFLPATVAPILTMDLAILPENLGCTTA